ncbi:MAG: hypothetical protein GF419_13370 [Ignavibacteriales bacterium]|nr:hypothetical protein [Ignavibacteriales bacterium]
MKRSKMALNIAALIALVALFFVGCDENSITDPGDEVGTDREAMIYLIEQDEAIGSFDANYDEGGAQTIESQEGGIAKTIYPVAIGSGVESKTRTVEITMNETEDSAYANVTVVVTGTLYIAASDDFFNWWERDSSQVDTLIEKPFTETITRNVVFARVANTERPLRNWKVVRISLVEGSTPDDNISIEKMTFATASGGELVVEDPSEFYLEREEPSNGQRDRLIPHTNQREQITATVEVFSAYQDDDFVTVTWGALRNNRRHLVKLEMSLVSSSPTEGGYDKVYEATWRTAPIRGFRHAVVGAVPFHVVTDDATPVEKSSFGVPYFVK